MSTNLETIIQSNSDDSEKPPVRTQFLIFTLFGDYILERGVKLWTSELLYLMEVLGVSERAVRSALSRMTNNGWLISQKDGRRSRYSLTERGKTLLEKGGMRIFEPVFTDWDNQWHLVVYSLPESKRPLRHTLRTQLTWLGFGRLATGTWISPRNRIDDLKNLLTELDINSHIQIFSGQYRGPSSATELVEQCWDLDELSIQYQGFINRHEQDFLRCEAYHENTLNLDSKHCFIHRFWVTHEFQSTPFTDPNLPPSLLPSDWIGITARNLFHNYRDLLGKYAHDFVDEVLVGSG